MGKMLGNKAAFFKGGLIGNTGDTGTPRRAHVYDATYALKNSMCVSRAVQGQQQAAKSSDENPPVLLSLAA
jgi:hypothetical protein